jgi:hypothetical protein
MASLELVATLFDAKSPDGMYMDRLLDVYGRETGGNETTPMTSREVTSA